MSKISNIYYILKTLNSGRKLSKKNINSQEIKMLDSFVADGKIKFKDGSYSKITKNVDLENKIKNPFHDGRDYQQQSCSMVHRNYYLLYIEHY